MRDGKEHEMTKIDLAAIRNTLAVEIETITANIQSEQDNLHVNSEPNPDLLDLAETCARQSIALDWLAKLEQRLGQVTIAMKRLDEGLYGICEKCGDVINPARLEAMPHAIRCVTCQERLERVR
ncbi:MAG: TraR/DksA family transcriptional regulator [Chloroflexi bacterium]|nr:MAG: TraR/DksA family transcriptional regulator [Chloroflexota bacterium]MCE7859370.1 TraR/DksA family transcriptional regulator [Chloroflexi bacterium CFX2]